MDYDNFGDWSKYDHILYVAYPFMKVKDIGPLYLIYSYNLNLYSTASCVYIHVTRYYTL